MRMWLPLLISTLHFCWLQALSNFDDMVVIDNVGNMSTFETRQILQLRSINTADHTVFWYAGCWKSVKETSVKVHFALTAYTLVAVLDTCNTQKFWQNSSTKTMSNVG